MTTNIDIQTLSDQISSKVLSQLQSKPLLQFEGSKFPSEPKFDYKKLLRQTSNLPSNLPIPSSNPGNWTMKKPAIPFTTIYASDWNNEFQNVIDNCNPAGVAGASQTLTDMRQVKQPYIDPDPQPANSLGEELYEIRYQLAGITGEDWWYLPSAKTIKEIDEEIQNIVTDEVTGGDEHNHTDDPLVGGGAQIPTDGIEDLAVTTEKIADKAITYDKLADEILIGAVKQAKAVTSQAQFIDETTYFGVYPATNIPIDPPPSDGGTEIISLTITPKQINDTLSIECSLSWEGYRIDDVNPDDNGVVAAIYINDVGSTTYLCVGATFLGWLWHPETLKGIASVKGFFITPDLVEKNISVRCGLLEPSGASNIRYWSINKDYPTTTLTTLTVIETE